jgi:hypothetical protein
MPAKGITMFENTNPFKDSEDNPTLDMALEYIENGWPIFPVHYPAKYGCGCGDPNCKSNGKNPNTINGYRNASIQQWEVRQWFRHPNMNIGIATGKKSFYVLDIDVAGSKQGNQSLAALEKEYGKLPNTLKATTGSGGTHFCFYYDGEKELKCRQNIRPGIDFKGDTGYIVAAPSMHASGNKYEWQSDFGKKYIAEMPEWLLEVVTQPKSSKIKSNTQPDIHNLSAAPIVDGTRNDILFRLGCSWRENNGLDEIQMAAALKGINNTLPEPNDESEVMDTAAEICKRYPINQNQAPEFNLSNYVTELFEGYKQVGRNELLGLKLNKFKQLASNIRGVQNGFYLIPGESGAGKTMLLINLFLDLIESNDIAGYYISLDDPTKTIINRSLACLSGIAINDIQQLKNCDVEIKTVSTQINKIQNYIKQGKMNIYDISQIDHIKQLKALAAGVNKKFFICIDGMYNLGVGKYSNARDENVKRANELKKLADIHHIPVICTGEVRKSDGKGARKLGNDDIMESGKFIYNPNMILILSKIMNGQLQLRCSKNKLSSFDGDMVLNINKDKCLVTEQQEKF